MIKAGISPWYTTAPLSPAGRFSTSRKRNDPAELAREDQREHSERNERLPNEQTIYPEFIVLRWTWMRGPRAV